MMPPNDNSQQKHQQQRKKGEVIQTRKPWKIVPLFLEGIHAILAELPRFVLDDHNPLGPLLEARNSPAVALPGVKQLLKRAQHPDANIWSLYTIVTVITLVLQGSAIEDILRELTQHENSEEEENKRL